MKLILTVISGLPEECYHNGIRVQVYDAANGNIDDQIKADLSLDQTVEQLETPLEELLEREHPDARVWIDDLSTIF